jgi:hypothetical protein
LASPRKFFFRLNRIFFPREPRWGWPTTFNELLVEDLFRLSTHLRRKEDRCSVTLMGSLGSRATARVTLDPPHLRSVRVQSLRSLYRRRRPKPQDAPSAQGRVETLSGSHSAHAFPSRTISATCRSTKNDANLLFQVISHRYERGSPVITINKAAKNWTDFSTTSPAPAPSWCFAPHANSVVIEGKSFRMNAPRCRAGSLRTPDLRRQCTDRTLRALTSPFWKFGVNRRRISKGKVWFGEALSVDRLPTSTPKPLSRNSLETVCNYPG